MSTTKITPYDNIEWFMSKYAPEHNWDTKTGYSFLVKEWNNYKKNKTGKDVVMPAIREHIEKNNPILLEWFDGLLVLV